MLADKRWGISLNDGITTTKKENTEVDGIKVPKKRGRKRKVPVPVEELEKSIANDDKEEEKGDPVNNKVTQKAKGTIVVAKQQLLQQTPKKGADVLQKVGY